MSNDQCVNRHHQNQDRNGEWPCVDTRCNTSRLCPAATVWCWCQAGLSAMLWSCIRSTRPCPRMFFYVAFFKYPKDLKEWLSSLPRPCVQMPDEGAFMLADSISCRTNLPPAACTIGDCSVLSQIMQQSVFAQILDTEMESESFIRGQFESWTRSAQQTMNNLVHGSMDHTLPSRKQIQLPFFFSLKKTSMGRRIYF